MTEPKLDRWKRYKLPDPTTGIEQSWIRATTIARAMDNMYGIHGWEKRMLVIALTARPDLLDLAYASDPEDKEQLDELCEKALQAAKSDTRSNQGTALHKFTARLDKGELSRSPRQWADLLDIYRDFKDIHGIITHPTMVERITVVPELGVAGTLDRIVKHEGVLKIADLKTGGSLDHGQSSIAIQLAIYAHGEWLWNKDKGQWSPMPKVSQTEALIIYLPATGDPETGEFKAEKITVDIERGWEEAKHARHVYDVQKDKTFFKREGDNA